MARVLHLAIRTPLVWLMIAALGAFLLLASLERTAAAGPATFSGALSGSSSSGHGGQGDNGGHGGKGNNGGDHGGKGDKGDKGGDHGGKGGNPDKHCKDGHGKDDAHNKHCHISQG